MNKLFISVIIVTRNREDGLRKTLNNFLNQNYVNCEFIVIDNYSEGINWTEFRQDFPNVKFILLKENHSMHAFDFGLKEAKGEIIWRTDDDSNPVDLNTFEKVNIIFQKFFDIDIIATEIQEPLFDNVITPWYPFKVNRNNVPENGYKSNTFYGAGAAIRKKVFDKIGTFWGFGYEELDFSTRAILAGFHIRYFPNIVTDHYSSRENRNEHQRLIVMAMQQIHYHSKYFNFPRAFSRLILIIMSQNLEALTRKSNPKIFWKLNISIIKVFLKTRKNERIKVSSEMLQEITLGENFFLSTMRYFKIRINRMLKKIID
ncbi:MAG: hypothetical protein A2X64_02570 [Ignavibacteria bacterium GWF2_33_9]|nr:MAG: hypothetical protein A2X64_02570 [Ignavibacteria bacterium GWF2_33_9]